MKRIGFVVALLGAVWFAVEGGEYGTADLIRQRARRRELEGEITALRREVDSLARVKRALAADPAVQERIAREEFGMVRGREILYRFAEAKGRD